eukprot:gene12181-64286_t
MPNSPARAQIRGLFDLYQEERRREERTKGALRSLQQNSDEKILDTKVKDELALLREATNVALVETSNDAVRRRARDKIQRSAKEQWRDHFVSQLDDMERVRASVADAVAPKLRRLEAQRKAALDDAPRPGGRTTKDIIDQQCGDAARPRPGRGGSDAASKLMKPDDVAPADLAKLLDPKVCEPDPARFHDPTGKREAAINDLQERLILDRSARLNSMESEHEGL